MAGWGGVGSRGRETLRRPGFANDYHYDGATLGSLLFAHPKWGNIAWVT